MEITAELMEKKDKLKEILLSYSSLAVGFSGGTDSTFLLASAHECLGDRVVAVTARSVFVPERELQDAVDFCADRGIRHVICPVDPLKDEECRYNGAERCYVCKKGFFSEIRRIAGEQGIDVIAEGTNMDDLSDYRPGMRAVTELGVKAPLKEAGLCKEEIRALSKEMGLFNWDKPASACLASRIAYGEEITQEKLLMIDKAEEYLSGFGLSRLRVRLHKNLARIEVPEEYIEMISREEIRKKLYSKLKEFGFLYVTLDLGGFSSGSMNAELKK